MKKLLWVGVADIPGRVGPAEVCGVLFTPVQDLRWIDGVLALCPTIPLDQWQTHQRPSALEIRIFDPPQPIGTEEALLATEPQHVATVPVTQPGLQVVPFPDLKPNRAVQAAIFGIFTE